MTVTHRLGEDEEDSIRNLWPNSSSLVSLNQDKLSPWLLLNDPLVKKLQTKAEESINVAYPAREVIKLELVVTPSTRPNRPG